MLNVITGDLLRSAKDGDFDVIVHGCNCFNAMGAGIAYAVKTQFPQANQADQLTKRADPAKLGKFSYAEIDSLVVVNAYTQFYPGASFQLNALQSCLAEIKNLFGGKSLRFGFPKIGAGIGGGNWDDIKAELENFALEEDVTIVLWENEP